MIVNEISSFKELDAMLEGINTLTAIYDNLKKYNKTKSVKALVGPALEAHGVDYSLESVGGAISEASKKVIAWIVKTWKRLIAWIKNIFNPKLHGLESQLDAVVGMISGPKFDKQAIAHTAELPVDIDIQAVINILTNLPSGDEFSKNVDTLQSIDDTSDEDLAQQIAERPATIKLVEAVAVLNGATNGTKHLDSWMDARNVKTLKVTMHRVSEISIRIDRMANNFMTINRAYGPSIATKYIVSLQQLVSRTLSVIISNIAGVRKALDNAKANKK